MTEHAEPDECNALREFLLGLQDRICAGLEGVDGSARFREDRHEREGGGLSSPRVIEDGPVIERAAVNFSHTISDRLPAAASARRPELAGRAYQALSISLIVHPRNPYAPTSHANLRYFQATAATSAPVWWFGGGFDLTPYYGFEEDAVHWHRSAREACRACGQGEVHERLKTWCDEYFYLQHRREARGIGGLFFDDWTVDGFASSRALWQSIGEHFLDAYLPLLERRKDTPYGKREREFQLYRRGRYVEFNLIWDRGTLFGLQAGGRVESILASLPPRVAWRYDWQPEPDSPEAMLYTHFLPPRDWLG